MGFELVLVITSVIEQPRDIDWYTDALFEYLFGFILTRMRNFQGRQNKKQTSRHRKMGIYTGISNYSILINFKIFT